MFYIRGEQLLTAHSKKYIINIKIALTAAQSPNLPASVACRGFYLWWILVGWF